MMRRDTEGESENLLDNNEKTKYIRTAKTRVIDSEISASLPLQIMIYYNKHYSVLMLAIMLMAESYIQLYFSYSLSFLSLIILVLWALVEYLRLYYGFMGNIKESFPELIAFLILSIVFSLPLLAFFFIVPAVQFPIERSVVIVAGIFLVVEVILAIMATSKLVKNQTAIFFLRNSHPDLYYRVRFM